MNAKHYVSLEAAKKLKEINHDGLNYEMHIGDDGIIYPAYVVGDVYPCPALLEAMDWLESNGIHIEIRMYSSKVKGDPFKIAEDDEYQWKWYFSICKGDDVEHPILEDSKDEYVVMHEDRYECMNAAIEKALGLL